MTEENKVQNEIEVAEPELDVASNELAAADAEQADELVNKKSKKKKNDDEIVLEQVHKRNLGFIQRDYINPKNLGFMKVILFFFGMNILSNIIGMAVSMKSDFEFDFSNSMNFVNVILETVSFWLLWRRKKVARWWIIGICTFNITLGAVLNVVSGSFSIGGQIFSSFFDIILILYFLIAKRPKIVLNQPFSMETYKREAEEDADCFRPKTWQFWRDLIMYFCVFSVVGHWMEAAYCTLIRFGILPGIYDPNSQIWSDWLYPFLVYGFGCVACVLIFYPIKIFLQKRIKGGWRANAINVFITFVVSGIVCCLIELFMGLTMNMDYQLWDYRDMFGNFMGQICLQNGIAFGMIATLMTWVIYPALERVMDRLPKEIGNGLFIGIVIAFALLWLLYCFQPPKEITEGVVEVGQTEQIQIEELEGKSPEEVYEYIQNKVQEAQVNTILAQAAAEDGDAKSASELAETASKSNQAVLDAMEYYAQMPENQGGISMHLSISDED